MGTLENQGGGQTLCPQQEGALRLERRWGDPLSRGEGRMGGGRYLELLQGANPVCGVGRG